VERGEELIERIRVAGAGLNNPDSGVTLKVDAISTATNFSDFFFQLRACTMPPCKTAAAAKTANT
jgi:hypothetical protein